MSVKCQEVVKDTFSYLHQELDEGKREVVLFHLLDCRPCAKEYEIEETITLILKRSHVLQKAPMSLKEAVKKLLKGKF